MLKRLNFMNRQRTHYCLLLSVAFAACSPRLNVSKTVGEATQQTKVMLAEIPKAKGHSGQAVFPRTLENGNLKLITARDWTSGFFPGTLWLLHEYTGSPEWKAKAEAFTAKLESQKTYRGTHDLGFIFYCSYGNGYRLTGNEAYKAIMVEAAQSLVSRYNPRVGVIRSWDFGKDRWQYPVIIDNMMNLELLFAATRFTGDSTYYKIADRHATTTLRNHFRPDYSSYHVVDYDTLTGKAIKRMTFQGAADESAWARGQGWGLYGYTTCYRETKNPAYLQQAERIADFVLAHPNLPKDKVPYWDLAAPGIPAVPRDASAAALMASALYELSLYSNKRREYKAAADEILQSLTTAYRSPVGANKGFILLHSTGHKPHNSEVDVPLNYADYYYLEALLRRQKLREGKALF